VVSADVTTSEADAQTLARETLTRARDYLVSLQDPAGYWKGELETNVSIEAEDILLRHFLGIGTPELTTRTANWIRRKQREDGTWANFYGGPGELSTTVEAYVALKMAGDTPDQPHMARAGDWIRAQGGLNATRVFTRMWLAMSGRWSWDELPVIPPEVIYLPSWFPLNIYDWGCWARQTIVALAVVQSFRPSREIPVTVDELFVPGVPVGRPGKVDPNDPWARAFDMLDRALHRLEPRIPASMRRAARRRCAEWIIVRQEADGCWGGIQPPWVYSLIALNLLGYDLEHPVMKKGLEAFDRYTIIEGDTRRIECCQSPVWDTVLVMTALADAGLEPDAEPLTRAADWTLAEEIRGLGDWQVRRPATAPGGWAFEFDNDNYPDTDDTAETILALRRVASPEAKPAIERGLRWLEGMQSKDGGWGAFDADNTRMLVNKLPFCDFGAVIDPPSADVTAHIVEALAAEGLANDEACRRGVVWLLKNQEPDGSWFGRWGANYVYGTGAAVPALIAAGVKPDKPWIRNAVRWLREHQNADGGWGEDLRSYDDPGQAGRGASTASQTAWALLALLAAGERDSDAVTQGIMWLVRTQQPGGGWDEPWFTGTGFPGDFYINYHLYRLAFPVSALGRYVGEMQ
jgi:squalene-hopene/tetraprenyl-beta-curcumene cyclase